VSGHADTIRETLLQPVIGPNGRELAMRSLDALVAENQRLRDALEAVASAFTAWSEDWNDGTYAYYKSDDLMVACVAARAALDGTPSEDPPIEDLPDPSHDDVRGRAPSFNLFRKPSEDT
jgi:hypothetical protein